MVAAQLTAAGIDPRCEARIRAFTANLLAQPADTGAQTRQTAPEQHQQMMSSGRTMGHSKMMMSDAEMGRTMEGCPKMMKMMGDKSAEARDSISSRR